VTPLVAGLLVLAAVGAVADWVAIWRGIGVLEPMGKMLAIFALFAAVFVWPMAPGASATVRICLIVALAASLVGDLFLLRRDRFVQGLVAFLVAQLAYLAAFVQLPGGPIGLLVGIGLAFVLIVTVGHEIVDGALKSGKGQEAAVAVYLAAICGMAITATRTGMPLAMAGAWLFVASDSILGWDRFAARPAASERVARTRHLAVMVTYHLGQALLVVALAG
jgi:uncharacterized membrane protein YhhN